MPLAVTYHPLKALIPYARNSRTHPASQVAKLQGSLAEFGWTRPIAIADGVIIFGHGILAAALQMAEHGIPIPGNADPDKGPTVDLSHLSKAQRRAYVIADNKLALGSGWDDEMLRIEITGLQTEGFNIELTGFDSEDLSALFSTDDPAAASGRANGSLADRFGVAPFSVLNAREGWWQERKRGWLALGIRSEIGRGGDEPSASFKNQGALRALQNGEPHRKPNAIPGGAPMPLDRAKNAQARGRANATPGGSMMPAADYGKSHARGDGRGRAVEIQDGS